MAKKKVEAKEEFPTVEGRAMALLGDEIRELKAQAEETKKAFFNPGDSYQCAKCAWFDPPEGQNVVRGWCRKEPPKLVTGIRARWPDVNGAEDWCGAFTPLRPGETAGE